MKNANISRRTLLKSVAAATIGLPLLERGLFARPTTANDRIHPYDENPYYWQYKGNPVLLIGGSDDDNLYNFDLPQGLESHLELLASVGGNYIRNTMSSRDPGAVWAFHRLDNDKYDLKIFNPEYWDRFERLLKLAHELDIIVQVEIWDPWDYFYDLGGSGWSKQPFNPINNVNYDAKESKLATEIDYPSEDRPSGHNFFHTVPALEDNRVVLKYQKAFVGKILEHSLSYPNVLYCVSNELGEPLEWSVYWAEFVRERAEKKGVTAQVADMRRANNINSNDHKFLQDHPETFSFLDISQNNGGANWGSPEERHWAPMMELREHISGLPRPINNTKIYGSGASSRGGQDQALQKFWRAIFAGCASARFHRPQSGLGLSGIAQTHIKSMRMLSNEFSVFSARPHNDLLGRRESNEAYCLAETGKQYAVYFTDGGSVDLDLRGMSGFFTVKWLDIARSEWTGSETIKAGRQEKLTAPQAGHWSVVIKAVE